MNIFPIRFLEIIYFDITHGWVDIYFVKWPVSEYFYTNWADFIWILWELTIIIWTLHHLFEFNQYLYSSSSFIWIRELLNSYIWI